MAIINKPKLLIADEPTTALDRDLSKDIMNLLANIQKRLNLSILLITHDLNLVEKYAHKVSIMRQGEIVEYGNTQEILESPKHSYTKYLINSKPARLVNNFKSAAHNELLSVKDFGITYQKKYGFVNLFTKKYKILKNLSFNLHEGETLGLIGKSGSGKPSIAMGLLKMLDFEGKVLFQGVDINTIKRKELKSFRRKIQYVFQDPYESLNPRFTIKEIIAEGAKIHD